MSPLEPTPPFLKSLIWMNPLLFSMGKSRSRRQKKFDHSPTVRSHISKSQIYFLFLLRFYLLISIYLFIIFIHLYFREGKGERKRGRETSECGCLCAPLLGTWPATQARALTGNRTGDPLVHRPALNPLSHTSQGYFLIFLSQRKGPHRKTAYGHAVCVWHNSREYQSREWCFLELNGAHTTCVTIYKALRL